MKKITLFTALLSVYFASNAQTNNKPLIIGEIRTLPSKILNEKRTLNVYLPEKYDSSTAYPVVYVLDGSMDEDFLHITGVVQFFNLQFNMPKTIVVGIANIDRKRDFTFYTNLKDLQKKYPTTGHSQKFIQFIEEELQPYIQTTYKTNETKYLIGQSLGGLLASEILLKKPQLFTHYFIISPSLWWDNESLLHQASSLYMTQNHTPKFVYISVGKDEEPVMQKEAKQLYEVVRANSSTTKLVYNLMPKENHATILHNSFYHGLFNLFPYK